MGRTYQHTTDSGHGWLHVKRAELEELGIADKITGYSYQRGNTVYLEEDQDAGTFLDAMTARTGQKPAITHKCYARHSAPIRSYPRYAARRQQPINEPAESLSRFEREYSHDGPYEKCAVEQVREYVPVNTADYCAEVERKAANHPRVPE